MVNKITAVLGKSHSEFEHQLKNSINNICDVIDNILNTQNAILEYQNKLFNKQHVEIMKSSICNTCKCKADVITINLCDGVSIAFCNKCLSK
jgi:hypothetical protein